MYFLLVILCASNILKLPSYSSIFTTNIVFQAIPHIIRQFTMTRAFNLFYFLKT